MDSSSANAGSQSGPSPTLNPEALSLLGEGISLVLSRWTALRMAIENEWGGRDSHRKSEELASTILSWFSQSKPPLYIDDLENVLDENMVLSFNTEIEDGSIEEVAEQLMIMHEDCLKGNYEPVEKLRKLGPGTNAVSQSKPAQKKETMAGSSKSSEIGSSRGRVTNWTDKEDKILSRLLKEEFLSGGTTGNTFTKPALLRVLERFNMEAKTNYSVHNMQNRMKNLRKLFRRYHYLATLSGWGWDPERQIPANTDEQWNSVISVNKELIHCRNKPFAPYEDMLIWYGKQVATGEGAATRIDYTSQQAIPALQSSEVPISMTSAPPLFNILDDCFFHEPNLHNETDNDLIHVELEVGGDSEDPSQGMNDIGASPTPQYQSDNPSVNPGDSTSDGAASSQGKRPRQDTTPITQRRRRFGGGDRLEILEELRRQSSQRLDFSQQVLELNKKMLAVELEKAEIEASCRMDKCVSKLLSLELSIEDFSVMSNIFCHSLETRQLFMMLEGDQLKGFVNYHLSHRGGH